MECIHGKRSYQLDRDAFLDRIRSYDQILIDIGTGDGRFVARGCLERPRAYFVGLDPCRENMCRLSGRAALNGLFVAASLETLPLELCATATRLTVRFPWAALLRGLLDPESEAWRSLTKAGTSRHRLELTVNAGALEEVAGLDLDEGMHRIRLAALLAGYSFESERRLDRAALVSMPSTWGKRLAFGRKPVAVSLDLRYPQSEDEPGHDPGSSYLVIIIFSFRLTQHHGRHLRPRASGFTKPGRALRTSAGRIEPLRRACRRHDNSQEPSFS
ncbi:MAG TPA: hypothetical protein VFB34_05510 [Chloroflexota bacterium]|nr:hypothetical protein [Chloroflexota bacterium]